MFVDHFDWEVPLYRVVDDVMSPSECASLIARVTAGPWLAATVNGPDGRYRNEKIRNNDLALVHDEALREALFTRLLPHLPPRMFGEALHSLHSSLRVYRYQVGQHFGAHSDQPYFDAEGRQSRLTLLVYLDAAREGRGGDTAREGRGGDTAREGRGGDTAREGRGGDRACVGGETAFLEIERPAGVVVTPHVGRALFFQQNLLHEGRPVTEGIKHVLRTDVIYAPD